MCRRQAPTTIILKIKIVSKNDVQASMSGDADSGRPPGPRFDRSSSANDFTLC
jgi:hypothetical protein